MINLTAYQDEGDYGAKFVAEQRKWIAEFEANPDGKNSCDASDFSGLLGEALTEIERLNSLIAERGALIERLVEAGENIMECEPEEWPESCRTWQGLVAEYRAMKGEK